MTACTKDRSIANTIALKEGTDTRIADGTAYVLRPTAEQARNVIQFLPTWLSQVRDAGGRHVAIDMSEVGGFDLSGFGVLLAKLRDVLRVSVRLTGIGVSEAVSLQSMRVLDGVTLELRDRRSTVDAS